jgi:hypothetical protein
MNEPSGWLSLAFAIGGTLVAAGIAWGMSKAKASSQDKEVEDQRSDLARVTEDRRKDLAQITEDRRQDLTRITEERRADIARSHEELQTVVSGVIDRVGNLELTMNSHCLDQVKELAVLREDTRERHNALAMAVSEIRGDIRMLTNAILDLKAAIEKAPR